MFEPELGQLIFGCPTGEFECPDFVIAGLEYLAREIERVEWNRTQEHYEAPTGNNGGEYFTETFRMRAYYWGDCTCGSKSNDCGDHTGHKSDCRLILPNFECDGLEIRWYKYLGRGMSINKEVDANEFAKILDKCLQSVRALDVGDNL